MFTVNGQEDYEKLFHGHGSPRVALMTDSFHTWLQAIEEYHAVALIQADMLENHLRNLPGGWHNRIAPLELAEDILVQICLVTNEKLSPVASDLQAFLQGGFFAI